MSRHGSRTETPVAGGGIVTVWLYGHYTIRSQRQNTLRGNPVKPVYRADSSWPRLSTRHPKAMPRREGHHAGPFTGSRSPPLHPRVPLRRISIRSPPRRFRIWYTGPVRWIGMDLDHPLSRSIGSMHDREGVGNHISSRTPHPSGAAVRKPFRYPWYNGFHHDRIPR